MKFCKNIHNPQVVNPKESFGATEMFSSETSFAGWMVMICGVISHVILWMNCHYSCSTIIMSET